MHGATNLVQPFMLYGIGIGIGIGIEIGIGIGISHRITSHHIASHHITSHRHAHTHVPIMMHGATI